MSERGAELDRSVSPEADTGGEPSVAGPATEAAAAASPAAKEQDEERKHGGGDAEELLKSIARLKGEQSKLREGRNKVSKDLKKAEKRRSRLKKKAGQLSDRDLRTVIEMRRSEAVLHGPSDAQGSAATLSEKKKGLREERVCQEPKGKVNKHQ